VRIIRQPLKKFLKKRERKEDKIEILYDVRKDFYNELKDGDSENQTEEEQGI
jgi:uncharacterized membrane protein